MATLSGQKSLELKEIMSILQDLKLFVGLSSKRLSKCLVMQAGSPAQIIQDIRINIRKNLRLCQPLFRRLLISLLRVGLKEELMGYAALFKLDDIAVACAAAANPEEPGEYDFSRVETLLKRKIDANDYGGTAVTAEMLALFVWSDYPLGTAVTVSKVPERLLIGQGGRVYSWKDFNEVRTAISNKAEALNKRIKLSDSGVSSSSVS